jgi:hypothetical protein
MQERTMIIYFVFFGILICGIGLTTLQIKQENKKAVNELSHLFEDAPET